MKLNKASLQAQFIKRSLDRSKKRKEIEDNAFKFITKGDLLHGHRNKHISKRDCNGIRLVMNQLRFN